jgi:hypothetical protein
MPYNCKDIENILSTEIETGIDWDDFENHLAECKQCRSLVTLDMKADESLRSAIPVSAPANNYADIMLSIKELEISKRSWAANLITRYLVPMATGVISLLLVMLNRPLFENAAEYFNWDLGKIGQYCSFVGEMKSSVFSETLKLSASPLIWGAALGIMFLIWYYSFSALEKAVK